MFKNSVRFFALAAIVCMAWGCEEDKKDNNTTPTTEGCQADQLSCKDNNVVICKDNKWELKTECKAPAKCSSTKFECEEEKKSEKICEEDAIRCDTKENKSYKCKDNTLTVLNTCVEGETCNAKTGACDKPQCTPGSKASCAGQVLTKCDKDGKIVTENCDGATTDCNADKGSCVPKNVEKKECTLSDSSKIEVGQSKCLGGNIVECEEGNDGNPVANSHECAADGDKIMTCRTGETACSALKKCDLPDGTKLLSGQTACNEDKDVILCTDGAISVASDCNPPTNLCRYKTGTYGEFECRSADGTTCELNNVTLNNNELVCDGNVLKKCEATSLNVVSDCAANHDGKSLCEGGECVPAPCDNGMASGAEGCSNDLYSVQKCLDGELSTKKECGEEKLCWEGDCKPAKEYSTIKKIHGGYDEIAGENCSGKKAILAKVTAKGVVTAIKDNGFFVQDPGVSTRKNAGILVRCYSEGQDNCVKTNFTNDKIEVGDNVKVTAGFVGYNDCQLWITTNTPAKIMVEKTTANKNIDAIQVDVDKMNTGKHNDYNGSVVYLNNIQLVECDDNSSYCLLKDEAGHEVYATNYVYNKAVNTLKAHLKNNVKYFDLIGIVYYNSKQQTSSIAPFDISARKCEENETKCENAMIYVCKNGGWKKDHDCVAPAIEHSVAACSGNQCDYECESGYTPVPGNLCVDCSSQSCDEE